MYQDIKLSLDRLIHLIEFQKLVHEYRFRYSIPYDGFDNTSSDEYKNWVKEALRKTDLLREQFLFIAKRCRKVISGSEPIPLVLLSYYFMYGKYPNQSIESDYIFTVKPSGILGSFDFVLTVPLLFEVEKINELFSKSRSEIIQISKNVENVNSKLSEPSLSESHPKSDDMLATTPVSGSDLVDKVHRDIGHLAEFGRVVLREHLQNMKESEFSINTYDDKNKPIYFPIRQMGTWLLNRQLYPILEEYWKQIEEEIKDFNKTTGKRVNRGIPLANTGVAQIAQGKTVIGLFNIYRAYQDDKECLQHIPSINIDPEKDMSESILFTQFEERQTSELFNKITTKYKQVFQNPPTLSDLSRIIKSLGSEKKLLLYMILYRFSSASYLNHELTTVISRSEIIRSLAELALWFEDEIKRKDNILSGQTLVEILDKKMGQLNPVKEGGKYTKAKDLEELHGKIIAAINTTDTLEIINGRIMTCLRNFAGHSLDVQDHKFFEISDEVFARMISLIFHAKKGGWI